MFSFKHSSVYRIFLRLTRVLQLVSALSSLVVFSLQVRKLLKLTRSLSTASGAVEGILAAAAAYTSIVTALTFIIKAMRAPSFLRWLLIALDIAFVGAFIAVAVLTSPNNRRAGICYGERKTIAEQNGFVDDESCQLPLGTFITAIISTILHALTAIFHEARDHHREHAVTKEQKSMDYNRSSELSDRNLQGAGVNGTRSDRVV